MVLDGIVRTAVQDFSYLRPFISYLSMLQEESPLFFIGPILLFDFGVQVVVPSLSTLFSYPSGKVVSDWGPFLGSILLYKE